MLAGAGVRRYYIYGGVTDMRKSFNGLSGLVRNEMKGDLLSGDAFIFINRRHTMMKILVWDRTGFVIYYKRLEKGTYELPVIKGRGSEIDWADLVMILEGVRLKSIRRRPRYAV
jgi:transposase